MGATLLLPYSLALPRCIIVLSVHRRIYIPFLKFLNFKFQNSKKSLLCGLPEVTVIKDCLKKNHKCRRSSIVKIIFSEKCNYTQWPQNTLKVVGSKIPHIFSTSNPDSQFSLRFVLRLAISKIAAIFIFPFTFDNFFLTFKTPRNNLYVDGHKEHK